MSSNGLPRMSTTGITLTAASGIHHSSFIIHHSSFIIHKSSFIVHHVLTNGVSRVLANGIPRVLANGIPYEVPGT